jgi:uncharacterized protein YnzC (UPF0291/DUF896 family)
MSIEQKMNQTGEYIRAARAAAEAQRGILERVRELQAQEKAEIGKYQGPEAEQQYQEAWRQNRIEEIRRNFRARIREEAERGVQAAERTTRHFELGNLLRKARLLGPEADQQTEIAARSQYLKEAQLMSEEHFAAELQEAVAERALGRMQILGMALAQRPFAKESERSRALAMFKHLTLAQLEFPEISEALEEVRQVRLDLESALEAVAGGEDVRLLMHVATERYRQMREEAKNHAGQ